MKKILSFVASLATCIALVICCSPVNPEKPDDPQKDEPQVDSGEVCIKIDGKFADWNNINIVSTTKYAANLGAIDVVKGHMDGDYVYIYLHCADKSKLDNVRICVDNDADTSTGTDLKGTLPSRGYTGMINITNLKNPNASVFYKNLSKGDKETGLTNFITSGVLFDEDSQTSLQLELAIDRIKFEEFYPIKKNGFKVAVYAIDESDQVSAVIPSDIPLLIKYEERAVPPAPEVYFESYSAPEPPFEYDVTYEYDPSDFSNPERGPYHGIYVDFKNGKIPQLTSAESLGANLAKGCSIILFSFYITDFMNCDISQEALDAIRQQFQNLRESGCKTVFRIAYSYNDQDKITDAPVDQALRHVEQFAPIIQEYSDVIMVWQAGFVGLWGEMHSTTHFQKSEDVNRLLRAELDVLPKNRQIAVRTNGRKTAFLGTKVADTLTVAEAYGESDKARIGFFNDCFLASSSDAGTFSSSSDRQMWKAESQYLCMGGESCYLNDDTDTYCKCSNAYKDLKDYHWTYLGNHSYIANVWKKQGCYDDASVRVGYRFVLNGAAFEGNFAAGQKWNVKMCFNNYGYASLVNERKVQFVVRSVETPSEKYVFVSSVDPRIWKGGHTFVFEEELTLPSDIQSGKQYQVFIDMPDIAPTLAGRPEYSIRFANTGVWEAETGYNLLTTVTAK